MARLRMAQYGTKHGHAAGKLQAMLSNADVEFAGLFEPDAQRRDEVRGTAPYDQVTFFETEEGILQDATIAAVASEGKNCESLEQTARLVEAGKHVWYDKPAGDDWERWQQVVGQAEERQLLIQLGYMLRYQEGFQKLSRWLQSGLLGDLFSIRAHMSTAAFVNPDTAASRRAISDHHRGGIFFDLSGHMLDQVVWLMGRPERVTSFLRNDTGIVPEFADNCLSVLEYEKGMAFVDIAAMEPGPSARRFEVYGTRGSAIIDPLEPVRQVRLCLVEAAEGFVAGEQQVPVKVQSRQDLYEEELVAFVATVRGERPRDRSAAHELLVQEIVLRANGIID